MSNASRTDEQNSSFRFMKSKQLISFPCVENPGLEKYCSFVL